MFICFAASTAQSQPPTAARCLPHVNRGIPAQMLNIRAAFKCLTLISMGCNRWSLALTEQNERPKQSHAWWS